MEKMKKLLDTDPVTELDCFIGISARARRERERKAREEEEVSRDMEVSSTSWGMRQKRGSARTALDILVDVALGVRRPEKEEFPGMPRNVLEKILGLDGEEICKVFQKSLTNTDVGNNQNRLLMPATQLNHDFLTQTEKDLLQEKEGSKRKVIDLLFITPDGNVCEDILLKGWVIEGRRYYAIGEGVVQHVQNVWFGGKIKCGGL